MSTNGKQKESCKSCSCSSSRSGPGQDKKSLAVLAAEIVPAPLFPELRLMVLESYHLIFMDSFRIWVHHRLWVPCAGSSVLIFEIGFRDDETSDVICRKNVAQCHKAPMTQSGGGHQYNSKLSMTIQECSGSLTIAEIMRSREKLEEYGTKGGETPSSGHHQLLVGIPFSLENLFESGWWTEQISLERDNSEASSFRHFKAAIQVPLSGWPQDRSTDVWESTVGTCFQLLIESHSSKEKILLSNLNRMLVMD
ncbi:hypothetical protein C8J56DRAFT_896480 [Mycena floridula]|nr:hypothetical protein C8J56DRAFT_896480 [Mycena floridula]